MQRCSPRSLQREQQLRSKACSDIEARYTILDDGRLMTREAKFENGKESQTGWIFVDYQDNVQLSDMPKHTKSLLRIAHSESHHQICCS